MTEASTSGLIDDPSRTAETSSSVDGLVLVSELFRLTSIDMLGVGGGVIDFTMPEAQESPFPDVKDKVTAEEGSTLETAARLTMRSEVNQGAFRRIVKLGPEVELSLDIVRGLYEKAHKRSVKTTGGAIMNGAGTFSMEKRPGDTMTVVASSGKDEAYHTLLTKQLEDIDAVNELRESRVNPKSTVFPWADEDKFDRDIVTKRPEPPEFDPELLKGKNSAFITKLSDPTWALETGRSDEIKAMMWVPGDTLAEMSEQVIGGMKRDGSRFVICNLEEAAEVFGVDSKSSEYKKDTIAKELAMEYPGVNFIVTDGANGSGYAIKIPTHNQGENEEGDLEKGLITSSHYNDSKLVKREGGTATGAGDTYSMTLYLALLYGFEIREAMEVADFAARKVMLSHGAMVPEWDSEFLNGLSVVEPSNN